jgi:pentapeptide MXKDX repeat protein
MSQKVLDQVLRRASSDAQFRGRLQADFEGALRGYDLTPEEKKKLSAAADLGIRSTAVPDRQAAAGDAMRADAGRAEAGRAEAGRAEAGRQETLKGDTLRGDSMRGDTLRGDTLRGDTLRGDTTRSDS